MQIENHSFLSEESSDIAPSHEHFERSLKEGQEILNNVHSTKIHELLSEFHKQTKEDDLYWLTDKCVIFDSVVTDEKLEDEAIEWERKNNVLLHEIAILEQVKEQKEKELMELKYSNKVAANSVEKQQQKYHEINEINNGDLRSLMNCAEFREKAQEAVKKKEEAEEIVIRGLKELLNERKINIDVLRQRREELERKKEEIENYIEVKKREFEEQREKQKKKSLEDWIRGRKKEIEKLEQSIKKMEKILRER